MATNSINTNNMVSVSLPWVINQIKRQIEDGDINPVGILGKSGIGKTESIRALAKELGIGFKELRLSHYQESDLIGLPYVSSEDGMTRYASSSILPDSKDPNPGILLLDEVTSANKSMRSAVYQIMDGSRRLGEWTMPEKWMVVACGNGEDDGGDYRGIEAAFMSRGMCFRVEENIDAWKEWALRSGVHPTVIAYLTFQPTKLHVMNPEVSDAMIACPRNWVKLSTQLKNMEKRAPGGILTDYDDLFYSAGGCIGKNEAPGFCAFYQYNKSLISVEEILEGKVTDDKMRDVSDEVILLTSQNLIETIRKELPNAYDPTENMMVTPKFLKKFANAMNWAMGKNMNNDTGVMIVQDLLHATKSVEVKGKTVTNILQFIILSSEFDDLCPSMLAFLRKNQHIADIIRKS